VETRLITIMLIETLFMRENGGVDDDEPGRAFGCSPMAAPLVPARLALAVA